MNELEKSLKELSEKIKIIQSKREERLSVTKGRFNLFTILRGIGEETQLHSNFICYLLNPKADHDCGRTFLDLFIETLIDKKNAEIWSNSEEESEDSKLLVDQMNAVIKQECKEVRTEKGIDNKRRMDIYLEFQGTRVAIENKIWAGEQKDQISDYAKFLNKFDTKNFLFYLTLWGNESQTAGNQKYFIISYEKHILDWIERCLKATYKYVNINQALQQYENVIRRLTNQTMEVTEMTEIQEIIKKNPEIIRSQKEINNSIESLKNQSMKIFWEKLRVELNANKSYNIHMDEKIYGNQKKWYGFSVTHIKFLKLYFYLVVDNESNFFMIGLHIGLPAPEQYSNLYKSKLNELKKLYNEELILNIEFKGGIDSNWPAGTFHISPAGNEFIISILNDGDMQRKVDEVAKKIHDYIDFVAPKIENVLKYIE